MLNENQYATSEKFDARIYLNAKFKTNPGSWFKWIFGYFPKYENLSVLELGCGTGLFWLVNRNEIPKSWEITLTDYSEGMLEGTRKSLSRLSRGFKYEVVNAEDIRYPDKHFDIIIANNMLYHVENRPAALSHIYRTLKDSGTFFASTMGKKDMLELNLLFYKFLDSRNRAFRFREHQFSLENGMDQLKAFFPDVAIYRYEDTLKINEAEPVINYYLSFNDMHENLTVLHKEDIDKFREYLQDILNTQRIISVTKDTGIFICSK